MSRQRHIQQAGSALTEAAICLPVLLLLIQGALHFGHGFYYKQEALTAARYLAWRQMRPEESTIAKTDYEAHLARAYPMSGDISYKQRKRGWDYSVYLTFSNLARELEGWAQEPYAGTPIGLAAILGLNMREDVPMEITAATRYEPFLPFLPTTVVSGTTTVPGASPWCKEDLGGEFGLGGAQLELLKYITNETRPDRK